MKKILWLMPLLVALPLHAEMWDDLKKNQGSLLPQGKTANGTTPVVKKPAGQVQEVSETTSVNSAKCLQDDQTSLPLSYMTALLTGSDRLSTNFDPRKGTLEVSAPGMINNCESMLQWKMKEKMINNKLVYAVELKIKAGDNCSDEGCEYQMSKLEGGDVKHPVIKVKPNLKGFKDCLEKSGVYANGKVDNKAIYSTPVLEKFTDMRQSGQVMLVSNGPNSALAKAQYGEFKVIDGCDHYETLNPDLVAIQSLADEEKQRLDAEAAKLRKCGINEYHKVSDFIEKYEEFDQTLKGFRDDLIRQAAVKAAKAFDEGKFSEEDLKVMADFDKYIVQPLAEKAGQLYIELKNLDGSSEAAAKKEELQKVMAKLKEYYTKPYFVSAHTKKLILNGRFEDAEKMNTMILVAENFGKLGAKMGTTVQTPDVAVARVKAAREKFKNDLVSQKEIYSIRTGEVTGKEAYYKTMASNMRNNIQIRTENFNAEIQDEFVRMQQGGYCYQYFRNTQKCIQDSMSRVQELQALLKHYNRVDAERAVEYDGKAAEYGKLEAEGRRYIAAQNGEEVPVEKPATEAPKPADTTTPTRRTSNGAYTFDYNPQQQGMQQPQGQIPNPMQAFQSAYQQGGMFQQPYNPYQSSNGMQGQMGFNAGFNGGYQQPQPFIGQQAYNGFGAQPGYGGYSGMGASNYNFNWGGAPQGQQPFSPMGGYGQPQQQGYWGQPYQAYGGYSMYAR